MYSAVAKHVVTAIQSAQLQTEPYAWFQVDKVWPTEFYQQMLANRIPNDCLFNMRSYKLEIVKYSDDRQYLALTPKITILSENIRKFWENFHTMFTYDIEPAMLAKFDIRVIPDGRELLYTRDGQNYCLGPHIDKPNKIAVGLFYLPTNSENPQWGTALFTPKDPNIQCEPGKHYGFENFNLHKIIDYVPNKLFAITKNPNAFHGVLPMPKNAERNLLIFNIIKSANTINKRLS